MKNIFEDEQPVQDGSVDLDKELREKIKNALKDLDFMEGNDELKAIIEKYKPVISDLSVNTVIHNENEIKLELKGRLHQKYITDPHMYEYGEVIIPPQLWADILELCRTQIIARVPELDFYPTDVLRNINVVIKDLDFFMAELDKYGGKLSSGLITAMDLYDDNDAPQFRKNIPLLEFLKMDIYDNFVLPHPIHLSADYMPKRQALVKKGRNIFKIYGHGTFEGHEYKFQGVSVTIYNRGWHKRDYTTETNPLPVHQAHHLYMNLSFYGPLTYDGVLYRGWSVPDNMKKEISDFCIALENEIRQIGKAHHIDEINISGYIDR